MISCTEFIPSYSELFSFLEERYGFAEVERYWNDIFNPERNGVLNRKVREHGIRGCYEYWAYSLNEEAADFKMMLNERDGWFSIEMRHCPSKGRLLALSHIKPYDKYCLHCDLYRKTVEKYGLCYDYDFTDTDRACCATLIYDPKIYRGRRIKTDDTLVMDRQAQDNRYLHREFHNYMSMGLEYLGTHFGQEAVEAYLRRFARNYYAPLIESIRKDGLAPLGEQIRETYRAEEAEDVAHIAPEGDNLRVRIDACPAVAYLRAQGWTPSTWFGESTRVVMDEIARQTGLDFVMSSYAPETGAAEYAFAKRP